MKKSKHSYNPDFTGELVSKKVGDGEVLCFISAEEAAETKLSKNPKWKKACAYCNKFLYSDLFLFALLLTVFLSWLTFNEIAGLIIIVLTSSAILFLKEDISPLIGIIFMVAMLFPAEVNPASYGLAFLSFIPLPFAIVYHLIHYRKRFKIGKMFFPQLAISVALLSGGLGSITPEDYLSGFAFALLLGFVILLLYFIFYNYMRAPASLDLKKYLSKVMIYTALLICLQVFVHYLRTPDQLWNIGDRVSIGWAIGNNFSTIMLFLLPGTCYLALKSKYSWAYVVFAGIQYVIIVLSWSRGGILASFIILPFLLAYTAYKADRRNRIIILATTAAIAAIVAICLGIFHDKVAIFASRVIDQSFGGGDLNVSGRDDLYKEAWQCFLTNPVFGAGIGHHSPYYIRQSMPMTWFHSTLFQVIGSMGLVGIIAYVYYYFERYKIVIKKDVFNMLVFIGLIGFEGYSMIDTGTFIPVPTMLMVMLITLVLELTNKQSGLEKVTFLNKEFYKNTKKTA